MFKRFRLAALVAFVCAHSFFGNQIKAQLIIDTTIYNSPNQVSSLVQNVLLGNGVIASNFTFIGDSSQIGFFKNIGTNLGLDSGLVFSSGNVMEVGQGAGFNASTAFQSTLGDPDLTTILNNSPIPTQGVNDVAIIEFDFVPIGDSVKFDYVFASEEYPEFVCSYNDAFGLFISGPGINGPYANNAENIALVPGTTQEVSIATINDASGGGACVWSPSNTQYYVDNSSSADNVYDAFTTVLTAKSVVQCGETYHVKMALCDAGDWSYDSGIFLRAKSFVSSAVAVQTATLSGDSTIAEGCGDGIFEFYRPGAATDTLILPITIGGTALNGTDYPTLPDTLIFLPGINNLTLTVTPINDGIAESIESVSITFTQNICGTFTQTSTLYIIPLVPIVGLSNDVNVTCPGDTVTLNGVFSGGYPPYQYSWSNGDTLSSTQVSVNSTTVFYVTVSDLCGSQATTDTISAIVPALSPVTVTGADANLTCPGDTTIISALASGGYPGYTYTWYLGPNVVSQNDSITINTLINQTYIVVAEDACGSPVALDSVNVTVNSYAPLTLELGPDKNLFCPGQAIINPTITGGSRPLSYQWSNGSTDSTLTVNADTSIFYFLTVKDFCETTILKDSILIDVPQYSPVEASAGLDTSVCPQTKLNLSALAIGGNGNYHYKWEDLNGVTSLSNDTLPLIEVNITASSLFLLTVTDGCGTSDTVSVTVDLRSDCEVLSYNIVTPNGDNKNDFLIFKNLNNLSQKAKLTVLNRWGIPVFKDDSYQNSWSPVDLNDGVYYYTLEIEGGKSLTGFFSLQK